MLASIVAGERVEGGPLCEDINPSRPTEVVAMYTASPAETALAAVDAAANAAAAWASRPAPERGAILRAAGDLLAARASEIGRDLAREEGKTVAEGMGEVGRAAAILRYFAAQTLEPDGETYPSHSPRTFLFARRKPVGVVAVITPWNFPIAIPAWKIAPALAYGNTVCWKPAEIVPLTAAHFMEALADAGLPPGVVNLVLGRGGEVGDAIVGAAAVDAISFTGSNAVGRVIQQKAVARGAKVQLELGGKNAAIVLADADLQLAVDHVARGAFLSAGQKCTATSRVIVEAPVVQEFTERLAAVARQWPAGDALEPSTTVGPVASAAQLESIERYLALAGDDGGTLVAGGARTRGADDGFFIDPTVIVGLDSTSRVVQEEVFGPVAAVLPAENFDDAVREANSTKFGLTAALFTNDLTAALEFAERAEAGVVKINQESAGLEFHVPFGGTKESSSGSREQGKVAREFFTEWKTVYLDRGSLE